MEAKVLPHQVSWQEVNVLFLEQIELHLQLGNLSLPWQL